MSEPDFPAPLNPYAPASDGPLVDQVSDKVTRPAASGGLIVLKTLLGVTLSGSVFGLGSATLITFSSGFDSHISGILWVLLFGGLVGLTLSFVVALFVVPVGYFFCSLVRTNGRPWSGLGIQWFGAGCGFLSGFLCIVVPSGLNLGALAAGFIPGGVGALGTWLFVKPLARRTDSAIKLQAAIKDEIESNQSPTPEGVMAANPFAMENE